MTKKGVAKMMVATVMVESPELAEAAATAEASGEKGADGGAAADVAEVVVDAVLPHSRR